MTENTIEGSREPDLSSLDQQKRADGIVTIVLTADNHLGYAAFGQHPGKREERQQRLRYAFQQATDFAVGQGVDLFIQAGDLFDSTTPSERDRSFVAARLAQLRQAGIRTFALGGVHDTPGDAYASQDREITPAPQLSYANLGALHYFAPSSATELEPVIMGVRDTSVGLCGLGVLADHEGDALTRVHVQDDIERAAIPILILHAPIEGLTTGSSRLDSQAFVNQSTIANQTTFRYILAGYHHSYQHLRIGQTDLIVAGATQHIDFSDPDDNPGFVFLGLAADGIRWCKHIAVDAMPLRRLVISSSELWPESNTTSMAPTNLILERLHPLCSEDAMVQLRLEGELTRWQYHQLDLNQIRHYGEQYCFALAIDDSALSILPEQNAISAETGERFSPREELVALTDEWIAMADDEQEKKALRATREELLAAMDEVRTKR
jgi:DNA repair exonuclease SbcCD nuclease subunit